MHFDKLRLHLEDVLVADVTFNVLSTWSAAEKGWRTHLYRTGSRMFRGKRNLKLEGVNRAWWALSESKKSTSKRQPSGDKDMEIDSVVGKQPVRGPSQEFSRSRLRTKKQDRPLGHRGLWRRRGVRR